MSERLKSIAEDAIREHARDIEFMSLLEMYDDISSAEAETVLALIDSAQIGVTWA
jgi:hypothetical protein